MPGRDFTSPADFNTQLSDWLTLANSRVVRTIQARPAERLEADKAAMLALPPIAPAVGWVNRVRLGRDYYVRVDSSDYSVDPPRIGRLVDVTADLEHVEVRLDGRLIARHDRVWARRHTVTDPAHVATAKQLRQQFQQPPAQQPPARSHRPSGRRPSGRRPSTSSWSRTGAWSVTSPTTTAPSASARPWTAA